MDLEALMKTLFLDTETTGLHPPRDKLVEVAIIDLNGNVLLNTLVNPGREIGSEAIAIHHITDDMVATAPTLEQLWPEIQDIVRGSHLIIYNSAFDTRFFPDGLGCARKVTCPI
jgi:DNA polymerase-3 subunit epsilon|tara:strand:- start:114 stop:455 length:342 start_codon:yes stop_codon:yes gene_type:complete